MKGSLLPDAANFKTIINRKQSGLWIIENDYLQCALTNYGARVVSLVINNNNTGIDVALGYSSVAQYINATDPYYGAVVGRYANRIAKGSFDIENVTYQLPCNDGNNILHGGKHGFHNQVWEVSSIQPQSVEFSHLSVDGEEGFPGNMQVSVCYELDKNGLRITYRANTDKTTVVNLSNHTYFNLNGEGSGTVNSHSLQINAMQYTPVDKELIPTGAIVPVYKSPFDFTTPKRIRECLGEKNEQLLFAGGYDHNFVLEKHAGEADVIITGDKSNITMEVYSGQPGMQFYGGNGMSGKDIGKSGNAYKKQEAFVVEPQHFPDSPNHRSFPSTILHAGHVFNNSSLYIFRTNG